MTNEQPLSPTPRTRLRRHAERGRVERADLYAVLDAGLICHLGVVADGAPLVQRAGPASCRCPPSSVSR